jgi:hypothetical protein
MEKHAVQLCGLCSLDDLWLSLSGHQACGIRVGKGRFGISSLEGHIQFTGPSIHTGVHHNRCKLDRALVPGKKMAQKPHFGFP